MKKRVFRTFALALVSVFVISFATPALAYAQWPNPTWNQALFGVIKRGEKNSGKCLLVQWHCYAAKATGTNGKEMQRNEVDGVMGLRSEQYLKSYQIKKGLKADGKVGNATYAKMMQTMASKSDPAKGEVIYDTHDVLKVPKTSRHVKKGTWFTYNRNGKMDIIK